MEDFRELLTYNLDIKNKHIYVVSDIHGNYNELKRIINDINLDKDYLFILGDISARGKEPLKTLDYVMELNKNPHVYVTLGNCDMADYLCLREVEIDRFNRWIHKNYLVRDLANLEYNGNIPNLTLDEAKLLQITLYKKYTKYFDYLMDLKHCIITDKFVFTHAGVPLDADLKTDNYYTYVHSRDFYKKGHNLDKTVICGHIPAVIYRKHSFNDDPLFVDEKKIIMLDGGESIQVGGQINVLEINNEEIIGFKRYETYPKVLITKDQLSYTNYKGCCWPFLKVEILEKGTDFTLCKNKDTLEISYIKNEYLELVDNEYKVKDDCPAKFLNVRENEIVYLIKKFDNYSLCKKDGELGFIKNTCIKEI